MAVGAANKGGTSSSSSSSYSYFILHSLCLTLANIANTTGSYFIQTAAGAAREIFLAHGDILIKKFPWIFSYLVATNLLPISLILQLDHHDPPKLTPPARKVSPQHTFSTPSSNNNTTTTTATATLPSDMAKKSSKSKSETEPSKRKRNRTPSADLDNQQESSKKAMNEKITIAGASDEFRNPLQPSSEEKAALERLFSKVKPSGGLSPDWKGDEGKNKPTSPPRGRKKVARPVGANGTIKLVPVEESPRPSTSPSEPKATTDGPTAAEKEAINKASKRKESEESEGTGNRDNKKQKPFAENDNKRKEADHADTASTRRTGKKQKSAAQEKSKKRKETESDGSQSDSSTSNKKSKPTVEKSIEKRKDSGDSAAESNKDKKQKKTSTADNDAFIEKESRRSKLKRKMAETDFPDRFDNEDEEPKQEPEEKQDEKADSGKPLHRFIVFIGNLPYTTTVASLTKHLEALKPSSVRVPTDKKDSSKAKGFAFVEFKDASRMKSCLKLFHHTIFEGRKINVELTAGGGGSNASRKRKLADKNERLNAERKRRYEEEEAERDSKRAATEKKDDVDAAAPSAVHPSRMKRIRK